MIGGALRLRFLSLRLTVPISVAVRQAQSGAASLIVDDRRIEPQRLAKLKKSVLPLLKGIPRIKWSVCFRLQNSLRSVDQLPHRVRVDQDNAAAGFGDSFVTRQDQAHATVRGAE